MRLTVTSQDSTRSMSHAHLRSLRSLSYTSPTEMSARKRKFETDVKPKIESILGAQALVKLCEYLILRLDHTDLLVQIKPRLNDPKRSAEGSLISDLHKLAAVADSVCKQRPHTSHEWLAAADSLDREGACILRHLRLAICYIFMQESISGTPPVLSKLAQMTPSAKSLPHVSYSL